jgi:hypothetical protein
MGKLGGLKGSGGKPKKLDSLPTSVNVSSAENGGMTREGIARVQALDKLNKDRYEYVLGLNLGSKLSSNNKSQEYQTFLSSNDSGKAKGSKKKLSNKSTSDLRSAPSEDSVSKKTLLGA